MSLRSNGIKLYPMVAAALGCALIAPASKADLYRYTAGHADIQVGYEAATGLELGMELSSTAVVNGSPVGGAGMTVSPSEVVTIVGNNVLTTGNAGLPSPFAGQPIYLLQQTSVGAATRPFLGFGAEDVDPGIFVGDQLRLTLTAFQTDPNYIPSGGQFVLYQNGLESTPNMNTANGLSSADGIDLFALGHDHYNMGFTAAGVYYLTFTATGQLVGGGNLSTTATYRFEVGNFQPVPEPSSIALASIGLAGTIAFAIRRRSANAG